MKAFPRIPPVVRWFVLPSVAFVVIVSLFYVAELDRQRRDHELTESARVERGARLIAGDLQSVVADIFILTRHREFDRFGETLSATAMERLAHDFTQLLGERRIYDHVRFLDARGMEIVRVNFNGGNSRVVAGDDLQDKSNRYYFKPMIGLGRNDIYFSPLDINVEHGRVETQPKSAIRVGAPVFDERGSKRGVIIFNYRGDRLVERFTAAMAGIADHTVLLNSRGETLLEPVGSGGNGAATSHPARLTENFPTPWTRVSAAEAGQFYDDNGLYTFATVNPVTQAWRSGGEAGVAGTPRAAASGTKSYFWKVVAHVPWPTLRAQGHKATRDMLLFPMIPGYILLILICWSISRSERGQTRARAALRESEGRYERAVAGTNDGLWEWNIQTGEDYFSPRWAEILGYGPDELKPVVETFTDLIHPDDKDRMWRQAQAHLRHKAPYDIEFRMRKKSGEYLWVRSRGRAVWNEDGQPVFMAGSIADISERKLAAEKLRDSEDRLRLIMDSVPVGISYIDADERYRYVSKGYEAMLGRRTKDIVGKTLRSVIGEETYKKGEPYIKRALEGAKAQHENTVFTADGREISIVADFVPHRQPGGDVAGFFSLVQDVTERKQAEQALRQSELRYRHLIDSAEISIWDEDFTAVFDALEELRDEGVEDLGRHLGENPDLVRELATLVGISGVNRATLKLFGGASEKEFISSIDKVFTGDSDQVFADELCAIWEGRDYFRSEASHLTLAGGKITVFISLPVPKNRLEARSVPVSVFDITERKDMEAQLRQAQKMEAIGLLTGGVAHDFNNILAIILGNLELLKEKISGKEEHAHFVTTAISAAERGAKLTQQLLTFSRKQMLRPQTTDLNELVVELTDLMRRTVGETIHVTTELESGLWPARIDRKHLSRALLNLAINSRDAMATGGDLVIRTANRRLGAEEARLHGNLGPGAYVSVSVSDTGAGMTPEVLSQAFDPFFTTKDFGEGTGLGLSTVHGFARQSGGDIILTSEQGMGTTVELLFPMLEDTMTPPRQPGAASSRPG